MEDGQPHTRPAAARWLPENRVQANPSSQILYGLPNDSCKIDFSEFWFSCKINFRCLFKGYLGITIGGMYVYYLNYKMVERNNIEMRSGRIALYPLLFAERDRAFLKQFKMNRDEERKLMKNVPGWQVGTWYGEPIFKTLPKDTLIEPDWQDLNAHAHYSNYAARAHFHFWN